MVRPTRSVQKTQERRNEIKEKAKAIGGIFKLDKRKLARQHSVAVPTIYDDINAILKEVGPDEFKAISYNLMKDYENSIEVLRKIWRDGDVSKGLRISAIRAFFDGGEKYTKLLEAWGYKEKVADRVDLDVRSGVVLNINHPDMKYPELGVKEDESEG